MISEPEEKHYQHMADDLGGYQMEEPIKVKGAEWEDEKSAVLIHVSQKDLASRMSWSGVSLASVLLLGMAVGIVTCIAVQKFTLAEMDKRLDGIAELRLARQIMLSPIPEAKMEKVRRKK